MGIKIRVVNWNFVLELEISNWDLELGLWTGMGILIENGDWDLVLGIKIGDWDLVLGN